MWDRSCTDKHYAEPSLMCTDRERSVCVLEPPVQPDTELCMQTPAHRPTFAVASKPARICASDRSHDMLAAIKDPAELPATGVEAVMRFSSRNTRRTPTKYGNMKPAWEGPSCGKGNDGTGVPRGL